MEMWSFQRRATFPERWGRGMIAANAERAVRALTKGKVGFSRMRFRILEEESQGAWPPGYPKGSFTGYVIVPRRWVVALGKIGLGRLPWPDDGPRIVDAV